MPACGHQPSPAERTTGCHDAKAERLFQVVMHT